MYLKIVSIFEINTVESRLLKTIELIIRLDRVSRVHYRSELR